MLGSVETKHAGLTLLQLAVIATMTATMGPTAVAQGQNEPQVSCGYRVWQTSIWGALSPDQMPPPGPNLKTVEIVACRGEREAAGMCITNISSRPLAGRFWIRSAAEGSEQVSLPPARLAISTAEWIESTEPCTRRDKTHLADCGRATVGSSFLPGPPGLSAPLQRVQRDDHHRQPAGIASDHRP